MTTFYLAARFSRREELRGYRDDLLQLGHHVTASWIDLETQDPTRASACARQDIADIVAADCLIAFTEFDRSSWTCGGRHFEAGFAFAVGKRLMIIGPCENVFYSLPDWRQFDTWDALLAGGEL